MDLWIGECSNELQQYTANAQCVLFSALQPENNRSRILTCTNITEANGTSSPHFFGIFAIEIGAKKG
jgi:hypothetical protein